MKRIIALCLVITMALLSGCQYVTTDTNDSQMTGQIILEDDDFIFLNDTPAMPAEENDTPAIPVEDDVVIDEDALAYTITVTEGELVNLDLKAVDPDGDELIYTFTDPLNAKGRWQTKIGDEGRYLTTVTVSDGKLSTSEDILVVVERANRAPVIECPDEISIKEGEELVIDCNIYDEEGDNILISYEGWSTSSRKQTGYDDAGTYTVLVRSSDGQAENTKEITVNVENVNRAPVIDEIEDMTVMETNRIRVRPTVNDPDDDDVTISYSAPLDEDGEWLTDDGDAGTYEITVTASDGSATETTSFTITVTQINTAPVLKPIADITVEEGDEIVLPVNAYDPEGDELQISYAGLMDEQTYETSYDDAGTYEETVTVSDGVLETSKTFTITVEDKNRPPVFIRGGA